MNKLFNNKIISKYILIQPIIDIITSIMIREFNMSLSIGMIVRFAFLLYASIYLVMCKNKKINIFGLLFIIYFIISIIGNIILTSNFNLIHHLYLLIKMIYYPISLFFMYYYFNNNKDINNKIFVISSLLCCISIFCSIVTKTSYCSYFDVINCYKAGTSGYFNSANEYSLILLFLLGMSLISFIKKINILNILSFIGISISLYIIGTKTAYIGLISILIVGFIYLLINCIVGKKDIYKPIIVIFMIISFICMYGISPLKYNIDERIRYLDEINNSYVCEINKSDVTDNSNEVNISIDDNNDDTLNNVLFSGRDDKLKNNINIYNNSNIFYKLFGIGKRYNEIIEMDVYDLFIIYGILGFILVISLPLLIVINIIIKIIKNIKILFDYKVLICGIVYALFSLSAYIAGHCLFQPSVSFYYALILVMLNKRINDLYINGGEYNE